MSGLQSKEWTSVINGVEYCYYKFDGAWCVKQRLHRDRPQLDAADWSLIADDLPTKAEAETRIQRFDEWLTAVRAGQCPVRWGYHDEEHLCCINTHEEPHSAESGWHECECGSTHFLRPAAP